MPSKGKRHKQNKNAWQQGQAKKYNVVTLVEPSEQAGEPPPPQVEGLLLDDSGELAQDDDAETDIDDEEFDKEMNRIVLSDDESADELADEAAAVTAAALPVPGAAAAPTVLPQNRSIAAEVDGAPGPTTKDSRELEAEAAESGRRASARLLAQQVAAEADNKAAEIAPYISSWESASSWVPQHLLNAPPTPLPEKATPISVCNGQAVVVKYDFPKSYKHRCLLDVEPLCSLFGITQPKDWKKLSNKAGAEALVLVQLPHRSGSKTTRVSRLLLNPQDVSAMDWLLSQVSVFKLLTYEVDYDAQTFHNYYVDPANQIARFKILTDLCNFVLTFNNRFLAMQSSEQQQNGALLAAGYSANPRYSFGGPAAFQTTPSSVAVSIDEIKKAFRASRPVLQRLQAELSAACAANEGQPILDFAKMIRDDPEFSGLFKAFVAIAGTESEKHVYVARNLSLFRAFVRQSGRAMNQQYDALHELMAHFLYYAGLSKQGQQLLAEEFIICSPATASRRRATEVQASKELVQRLLAQRPFPLISIRPDNLVWKASQVMPSVGRGYIMSPNTNIVIKTADAEGLQHLEFTDEKPNPTVISDDSDLGNYYKLGAILEKMREVISSRRVSELYEAALADNAAIGSSESGNLYDDVKLRLARDGGRNSIPFGLLSGHNPNSATNIIDVLGVILSKLGPSFLSGNQAIILCGDQPIYNALCMAVRKHGLSKHVAVAMDFFHNLVVKPSEWALEAMWRNYFDPGLKLMQNTKDSFRSKKLEQIQQLLLDFLAAAKDGSIQQLLPAVHAVLGAGSAAQNTAVDKLAAIQDGVDFWAPFALYGRLLYENLMKARTVEARKKYVDEFIETFLPILIGVAIHLDRQPYARDLIHYACCLKLAKDTNSPFYEALCRNPELGSQLDVELSNKSIQEYQQRHNTKMEPTVLEFGLHLIPHTRSVRDAIFNSYPLPSHRHSRTRPPRDAEVRFNVEFMLQTFSDLLEASSGASLMTVETANTSKPIINIEKLSGAVSSMNFAPGPKCWDLDYVKQLLEQGSKLASAAAAKEGATVAQFAEKYAAELPQGASALQQRIDVAIMRVSKNREMYSIQRSNNKKKAPGAAKGLGVKRNGLKTKLSRKLAMFLFPPAEAMEIAPEIELMEVDGDFMEVQEIVSGFSEGSTSGSDSYSRTSSEAELLSEASSFDI